MLSHLLWRCPHLLQGRLLDAGTGQSSLSFVSSLNLKAWVAVTAEPARAQGLRERFPKSLHPHGDILLGNWQDQTFLQGERFDVVLADYLLGSCERYAMAFQEGLLQRLLSLSQGWLFLIGLEPWPEPQNQAQQALKDIAQLRDAVQILLGNRPHREIPQSWVEARLKEAGYSLAWFEHFENHYDQDFVLREISAVENNLEQLGDRGLAQALRRRCHQLKQTAGAAYSWDYLLAVNVGQPQATDRPPG